MKTRRRAALLLRALHRIRRYADAALAVETSHSHLVCALAEVRDLARRATHRRRTTA